MTISSVGNFPELPMNKTQHASEESAKSTEPSIYNAIEDLQITKEESEQLGLNRTYDLTKAEDIQAFENDTDSIISDKLEELKAKRKKIESNKKHVEKLLQDKQKLAQDLIALMQGYSNINKDASERYGDDVIGIDKNSFEKMIASFFNSKPGSFEDQDEYCIAKVTAETGFDSDTHGRINAYCKKINITLNGYGSIEVTPFGVIFTDNQGNKECIKKTTEEEKPKPGFHFADDSPNIPFLEQFAPPPVNNLKD